MLKSLVFSLKNIVLYKVQNKHGTRGSPAEKAMEHISRAEVKYQCFWNISVVSSLGCQVGNH